MTITKIKKNKHPDWWVQKSTTNCGNEIKIIHKVKDDFIPEHVKGECCSILKEVAYDL